jgi:hypothetical protein
MKTELESQLPMLKKQNLRNTVYATKSVQEIFSVAQMQNAIVKEVNYTSSCIAYNNGKGSFNIMPLPVGVQLSSVKSVAVIDVNHDGIPDLVLGGNEFGFQPQLGRLDASTGTLLINDGKGHFSNVAKEFSGIELHGQVRDIQIIKRKGELVVLFLQNNEYPVLYEF